MTDTKHTDQQLRGIVDDMADRGAFGHGNEFGLLRCLTRTPIREPIPAFYRGQKRVAGHAAQ